MNDSTLIIALALATLLIGIAVLVYQRFKVGKAQAEHHHSAMTEGKPEQRDD